MRPALGASDFVRMVGELQADARATEFFAALLGRTVRPEAPASLRKPPPPPPPPPLPEEPDEQDDEADDGEELPEPAFVTARVYESSATPPAPAWWHETQPLAPEKTGLTPRVATLFRPDLHRDLVRRLVQRWSVGRRVDVRALLVQLARRAPLREVPRTRVRTTAAPLTVVVDDSASMRAYGEDVAGLVAELATLVGRSSLTVLDRLRAMESLAKTALTLVVTDLRGRWSGPVGSSAGDWTRLLRGRTATVLVPATTTRALDLPAPVIEWSRRTTTRDLQRTRPPPPSATTGGALTLAMLVSPAARIEPALVRAMRLRLLPHAGPEVEGALVASELVAVSSGQGIALTAGARQALRRRLARRPELLSKALAVIADVHAATSSALALEERLTAVALEKPSGWAPRIEGLLRRVTRTLDDDARKGLARWVEQAASRLPPEVRATAAFGEAALRASAVLARAVGPGEGLAIVEQETARFLGTHVRRERRSVFVTAPEARTFERAQLQLVGLEVLRQVADWLGAEVAWLRSGRRRRFGRHRGRLLEQMIGRARRDARAVTRVAVLTDRVGDVERLRQSGFEVTHTLEEDVSVVVADPDSEGLVRAGQLALQGDVLLCLLDAERAAERLNLPSTQSFAEGFPERLDDRSWDNLLALAAFAAPVAPMRVAFRARQPPGEGTPVEVAVGGLGQLRGLRAQLDIGQNRLSVAKDDEAVTLVGARGRWRVDDRYGGFVDVEPVPVLWVARLYAAACRIATGGQNEWRSGVLVLRALGPAVLTLGDLATPFVSVHFGDIVREAVLEPTGGGLASTPFDVPRQPLRPPVERPTEGRAVALIHSGHRGPGHLVWGFAVAQADSITIHVQGHDLKGVLGSHTHLRGGPVLVEGVFAGFVRDHERTNEGWVLHVHPVDLGALDEVESVVGVALEQAEGEQAEGESVGEGAFEGPVDVVVSYAASVASVAREIAEALGDQRLRCVTRPLLQPLSSVEFNVVVLDRASARDPVLAEQWSRVATRRRLALVLVRHGLRPKELTRFLAMAPTFPIGDHPSTDVIDELTKLVARSPEPFLA